MAQLTQYDPNILQVYVEDLYRQAKWIIVTTTFKYAVVTFLVGFVLSIGMLGAHLIDRAGYETSTMLLVVLVVIAALVGLAAGRAKAWELKFDAQKVLLQMQIEKNTAAIH